MHTDGYTDCQMQTGFIICPMLYAIAMGQIMSLVSKTIDIGLALLEAMRACNKGPFF